MFIPILTTLVMFVVFFIGKVFFARKLKRAGTYTLLGDQALHKQEHDNSLLVNEIECDANENENLPVDQTTEVYIEEEMEKREKLGEKMNKWPAKCIKILVFLLFVMYNLVTKMLFENFSCVKEPDGELYLQKYPWLRCSSSDNQYFYGLFLPSILFTFLYTFGFPLAIFIILFRNRRNFHTKKFAIKFGFLYDNYKPNLWWMETAYICRRILIIAVISFFNTRNQELVVTMILFGYWIFFLLLPPYHERSEVNAEIFVTTTLIVLISAGSFYQYAYLTWVNVIGLILYLICFIYLFFALIRKVNLPCARFFRKNTSDGPEHLHDN